MNKHKKKVPQRKYIITISKRFEYPSCVIDSRNHLIDAFQKGTQDFVEQVEMKGINIQDFEVNLDAEIPYVKRPAYTEEDNRELRRRVNTSTMEYFVRELAVAAAEEKYGKLDPEENPDIYHVIEHPIYDEDDGWENTEDSGEREPIDVEEDYALKHEVSKYIDIKLRYYQNIIRAKGI